MEDPGSDSGNRLTWTPQAAGYAVGALGALLVGTLADSTYLVVLAGALLLTVVLEAAATLVRVPRVEVDVRPVRIPEEGTARITLTAEHVGPNHQFHLPLGLGLHLEGPETNLWHPHRRALVHEHSLAVVGRVRGPQSVGPPCVRNWSPARLWVHEHELGGAHQVEVVPRKEDVKDVDLDSRILKPMQGRFQVNRPGQGFDFFSLRAYQSGDTIRSVNWKATARKDELIVNQRQLETHSELLILLDSRVTMGVGPVGQTPLDRGCRLALGVYADAVSQRDTVRFMAYGGAVVEPPMLHADRVLRLESLLAKLPAEGTVDLAEAWRKGKREMRASGPIVIVSSLEAAADVPATVSDMLARGHPVTIISPEPSDVRWLGPAGRRQQERHGRIEGLRNLGAVVVDWKPGSPVIADKPTLRKVFA